MGNAENKSKHVPLKSLRSLMIMFPMAIVLGVVSIILFYIYLPKHPKAMEINALYTQRVNLQEEIRLAKESLKSNSENENLKKLLTDNESELSNCQNQIDRYGLTGYYLHTITDRADLLNPMSLNAIIGVGFIIVWYYLLISVFSSVPGLYLVSINPLKSYNYKQRLEMLEDKFDQTGRTDINALHTQNEYLSSLDENRAVLSMMPFYFGEWIMPILGFLGTVIGVSGAINELQVGIRMVFGDGMLTYSALEKFNSGFRSLGMAFDTTFLGLIGLMLSGLLAFILRRRAIAAIHTIDEAANRRIAEMQIKSATCEMIKEFMAALEEFYSKRIKPDSKSAIEDSIKQLMTSIEEWYTKKINPEIDKYLKDAKGFREELNFNIVSLREAISALPSRISMPIKKSIDHQTMRVNYYGEYLIRLAGSLWKAGDRSSRIHSFLAGCLVEAAMGPQEDIVPNLIGALRRPIDQAPVMSLLKESDGNGVECMAISSSYYLAIAIPPSQYNKSRIELYHLDMVLNRKVANSKLEAEINASVIRMAFNAKGTILAYLCADGALGVYDIQNDKISELLYRNLHPDTRSILWMTMGKEYVVLPVWIEEKNATQLVLIPYENECIGGNENIIQQSIVIEGFRCREAIYSARQSQLIIAGNRGTKACLQIAQGNTINNIAVKREVSLPEGRIYHITFANANEDRLLCSMDDGKVYQVSLIKTAPAELLADEKAPALFAESEEMGQYMVVGCEGRSFLQLYSSPDSAIPVNGYGVIKLGSSLPGHEGVVVAGEDGHLALWEYPSSIWSSSKYEEGNRK